MTSFETVVYDITGIIPSREDLNRLQEEALNEATRYTYTGDAPAAVVSAEYLLKKLTEVVREELNFERGFGKIKTRQVERARELLHKRRDELLRVVSQQRGY